MFNGSDDVMTNADFSQARPFNIYIVMKQVTWTDADYIFGTTNVSFYQRTTTPQLGWTCGSGERLSTSLAVGDWGIVTGK